MRYDAREEDSSYHKGFLDGMKSSFEERELDAYYAGVGYGKKLAGEKHLGFNSDEERQQFEAGIRNKGKHFRAYRAEPPTFWERLFGGKSVKQENAVGEYRNKRSENTRKCVSHRRKKVERRARRKKR